MDGLTIVAMLAVVLMAAGALALALRPSAGGARLLVPQEVGQLRGRGAQPLREDERQILMADVVLLEAIAMAETERKRGAPIR